jgi:hypothetical protein
MTLQTKGLDFISNEKLRSDIVELHEYKYDFLKSDYDKSEWMILQTITMPFTNKYFKISTDNSNFRVRPNDFESLKKNDEFMNLMEQIIITRKSGIRMYKYTMESIKILINKIETDLNSWN